MPSTSAFADRREIDFDDIETGDAFAPKFDANGVLPVVATDATTGDVVMLAYMNEESLLLTIQTGVAHYWSRSRNVLWKKGETSGNIQRVIELRTDCDQDALWMKVETEGLGASCHLGYRSCFFRAVPLGEEHSRPIKLNFKEDERVFDPAEVYGDDEGN